MSRASDFAARLNGRQYREEMTPDEEKEAERLGLLVVFGYSDDLIEFRGVIEDEVGCYERHVFAFVNVDGELRINRPREDHEELVEEGWTPPGVVGSILVQWSPEDVPGLSWLVTPHGPHDREDFASFTIKEDDADFCTGLVIDTRRWR